MEQGLLIVHLSHGLRDFWITLYYKHSVHSFIRVRIICFTGYPCMIHSLMYGVLDS
jgi:hypothetical protein